MRRQPRATSHSCSLLTQFYTPELADMVSEFAADDLRLFEYPRWSPSPQTPAPQPGPPLHEQTDLPLATCRCSWAKELWPVQGVGHLYVETT